MRTREMFRDRKEAGRRLARELETFRDQDPIILALPRGGVVIGYEVAFSLDAPLDVIVARKLGAPMQPELGIGAIAPGNVLLLDEYIVGELGLSETEIKSIVAHERREMNRRLLLYRGDDSLPEVQGRTAIIVDDGLATGGTARAAVAAVRALEPRRIVLAIPVCAPEAVNRIQKEVEDFVCLATPDPFRAVGLWYREFAQVSDAEVIELLEEARGNVAFESISEPD